MILPQFSVAERKTFFIEKILSTKKIFPILGERLFYFTYNRLRFENKIFAFRCDDFKLTQNFDRSWASEGSHLGEEYRNYFSQILKIPIETGLCYLAFSKS